jgi:hypothetical protein
MTRHYDSTAPAIGGEALYRPARPAAGRRAAIGAVLAFTVVLAWPGMVRADFDDADRAAPGDAAHERDLERDVYAERVVCRNERAVGSNIPRRVCRTERQMIEDRDAAREILRRIEVPVPAPAESP